MSRSGAIRGTIVAPPSKSMTQRAVAAALLAAGTSVIKNPSHSDDAIAARDIAVALGATVTEDAGEWRVAGNLCPPPVPLDCRESALCARLFAPIAALAPATVAVTGRGTLLARSMKELVAALSDLGVSVAAGGGSGACLPLHLTGPLQAGRVTIDASAGSQVLSGLLMALPLLNGNSEIKVERPVSLPYIDMTISVLQAFGVSIAQEHYRLFKIQGGQQYLPQAYTVEGDWSSAAFWLVVAAIGGDIKIEGLLPGSLQADRRILDALQAAGAAVKWAGGVPEVAHGDLNSFCFDATDCPDLFPPLVLLAAFCRGASTISGTGRLYRKESNRAAALQEVFGTLGIRVEIKNDDMIVHGGRLHGGRISSFHDHRIAMAAACAGLLTGEPVMIDDTDCIKKSYPGFLTDLNKLIP